MNPKVYQISWGKGELCTVKSFDGPVGIIRGLFRIDARYISWKDLGDKITLVAGQFTVKEIELDLKLVKWCPVYVRN